MEEHLTPEAIDRFAARTMTSPERAAARRHLLRCPACRERLRASPAYPEQGRREAEVVAAMAERVGCPEPRTKAAYVSEALSQEQHAAIAEHLRRCRACARDVRALEEIRAGATGAGQSAPAAARGPGCLLWFLRR
jgi:anti-sigma factor RsiW